MAEDLNSSQSSFFVMAEERPVRLLSLDAHIQRLLIETLSRLGFSAYEFSGEAYLPPGFVRFFTEHHLLPDHVMRRNEIAPEDLCNWYSFERLSASGQILMTAVGLAPHELGVYQGKLFVRKTALEPYDHPGSDILDSVPAVPA